MELSSIRRCFITYRESNANTDFPTLYSSLHFNPRTRMGCDNLDKSFGKQAKGFNPRTRTGCDGTSCCRTQSIHCFNPRTRTGCDRRTARFNRQGSVSIHAPARGATNFIVHIGGGNHCVSIHAPARGATVAIDTILPTRVVSIHAPARGAT